MLAWISDGYTEVRDFKGESICFRPLTAHRRADLARVLACLNEDDQCSLMYRTIGDCLYETVPISMIDHAHDNEFIAEFFRVASGLDRQDEEQEDANNLREGIAVEFTHPAVARVSCETCREWWFDPTDGTFAKRGNTRLKRGSAPLACESKVGCAVGHYTKQKRLSEKNRQALRHYLECVAVGNFPDDAIVLRNARIIRNELNRLKAIR